MSRSRRASAYHRLPTRASDVLWRAKANRRHRHAVRAALADLEPGEEPDVLPELREVSDVWTFNKDGICAATDPVSRR